MVNNQYRKDIYIYSGRIVDRVSCGWMGSFKVKSANEDSYCVQDARELRCGIEDFKSAIGMVSSTSCPFWNLGLLQNNFETKGVGYPNHKFQNGLTLIYCLSLFVNGFATWDEVHCDVIPGSASKNGMFSMHRHCHFTFFLRDNYGKLDTKNGEYKQQEPT